ncbi:MAG: HAMP domain-containing histidine kinase [Cellulomonadaceae bacterium]|jgi:signal transduction histidine kinase|nr:HAMP domain-containing histidine kinase [Cellulomonadaceae bacterium]
MSAFLMRVARSPITQVAALIAGFLAADQMMRDLSYGYARRVGFLVVTMTLPVAVGVLVASLAALVASVWWRGRGQRLPWRTLDMTVLVVAAMTVWIIGLGEVFVGSLPMVWAVLTYAVTMAVLLEAVARLRDKAQLFAWATLLRRFSPLRRLIGAAIAVLLAITLGYLVALANDLLHQVWVGGHAVQTASGWQPFILTGVMLCAIAYICRFILGLEGQYERANEDRVASERFRAELITNVSHDIRTPLTSIINYVDLLKRTPLDGEQAAEYLDVLDRKSARLKVLISDLLAASKTASGNVDVAMQRIDLAEIIGQISGEYAGILENLSMDLVIRRDDRRPEAESGPGTEAGSASRLLADADPTLLWRVLDNLFANAAAYALPGTRVFVEIGAPVNPTITIKNTSAQPIDLLPDALTEQFIRGDQARTSEGSGLGLYIARNLMELMGGTLTITVTGDLFTATLTFCPVTAPHPPA